MSVFFDENWKYKIAFDKLTLADITQLSFSIKPSEAECLNAEISFYKTYFSFAQVLNNLIYITNEKDFTNFKTKISKIKSNILYTPSQLKDYLENKIESLNEMYKSFLYDLLNYSIEYGIMPDVNKLLYKQIFGKLYKKIINKCRDYSKRKIVNTKYKELNGSLVSLKLDSIKSEINKNFTLQGLWGKFINTKYTVIQNNESGFGKYKSTSLGYSANIFTINLPHGLINEKKLEYNYYLNIYPGYGHFFETVLNSFTNSIDCGASFLINGWSTFSAWHVKPSEYTKFSKTFNCKITAFLLNKNNKKSFDALYLFLLNYLSKQTALKYLFEISQFRGRFESYILGALATELLISSHFTIGTSNYLNDLKKHNIGDYFKSYYDDKSHKE